MILGPREIALRRLAAIAVKRQELDRLELRRICDARQAGVTWQQIADRCGYKDRRGAQARYRTLAGRETPACRS